MLKALRWLLQGVLALLLLAVALWTVSRMMPMERGQREALAWLREEVPQPGDNAFAALWLLGYEEVPAAEREALAMQDVARHRQLLAALPAEEWGAGVAFESVASERFRQTEAMQSPCSWRQPGCLQAVREDAAAVAAALAGQQALLARIAELARYGHHRNLFAADPSMPMPPFQLLMRSLPAHALAHVQGRSEEALEGICNDATTARMLLAHGDNLLAAMIGAAMVEGNARLLAEVLAELPLDHPLPATCAGAFAPPTPGELSICGAMRGEFDFSRAAIAQSAGRMRWLVLDEDKTQGRMAVGMGWACTREAQQALALDEPVAPVPEPTSLWRLECAANAMGCILADIAAPAYRDYQLRLQDAGAQLRLAAALLWLRDQAAGSRDAEDDVAALLARLPPELAGARRPPALAEDGRSLQVQRHWRQREPVLSLPLPATLAAP